MSEHERGDRSTPRTVLELNEPAAVVLSAPRRQHVVSVLSAGGGRCSFETLAGAVAAELCDGGDGAATSNERVETYLHHCDLPKLARQGLVEYDGPCGDATLTDDGVECAAALGLG